MTATASNSSFIHHLRDIATGSAVLILVRVVGMAVSFGLMVFLARVLSPAAFGSFTLMFSLTLLGGLLVTLNTGAGSVRFLTEFLSSGDREGGSAYVRYCRKVVLSVTGVVWSVLVLCHLMYRLGWIPALPGYVIVAVLLAPVYAWLRVHAAHVAALGHVIRAAFPFALVRPVVLLSLVLVLYMYLGSLSLLQVVWSFTGASIAVIIVQIAMFSRPLSEFSGAPRSITSEERKEWWQVGTKLLVPTLFLELSIDTIVVISSWVLDIDQIAALGIVLRIQAIIFFGVTSVNMVVAPRIAVAHANEDSESVRRLILASAHLKLWPSLLVMLVLILFGRQILGVFGEVYQVHSLALLIVAVTPIVMAVFGPVVLFVTILKLQSQANRVFVQAIILLVILVSILGGLWNLTGVALATVFVWLFWHYRLCRLIANHSSYSTLQPRLISRGV